MNRRQHSLAAVSARARTVALSMAAILAGLTLVLPSTVGSLLGWIQRRGATVRVESPSPQPRSRPSGPSPSGQR